MRQIVVVIVSVVRIAPVLVAAAQAQDVCGFGASGSALTAACVGLNNGEASLSSSSLLARALGQQGGSILLQFRSKLSSGTKHNYLNGTLADAVRILDGAGIEYFAAFGTLLGIIRDGNLEIANDDVDLAFPMSRKDEVIQAFRRAGLIVEVPDWVRKSLELNGGKENLNVRSVGQVTSSLDLWGYYESLEGSTLCIRTYSKHAPRDRIFPLQRVVPRSMIGGPVVAIPRDPLALLREWYGEDWRAPSPNHSSPPKDHRSFTSRCGRGYDDRTPFVGP